MIKVPSLPVCFWNSSKAYLQFRRLDQFKWNMRLCGEDWRGHFVFNIKHWQGLGPWLQHYWTMNIVMPCIRDSRQRNNYLGYRVRNDETSPDSSTIFIKFLTILLWNKKIIRRSLVAMREMRKSFTNGVTYFLIYRVAIQQDCTETVNYWIFNFLFFI